MAGLPGIPFSPGGTAWVAWAGTRQGLKRMNWHGPGIQGTLVTCDGRPPEARGIGGFPGAFWPFWSWDSWNKFGKNKGVPVELSPGEKDLCPGGGLWVPERPGKNIPVPGQNLGTLTGEKPRRAFEEHGHHGTAGKLHRGKSPWNTPRGGALPQDKPNPKKTPRGGPILGAQQRAAKKKTLWHRSLR